MLLFSLLDDPPPGPVNLTFTLMLLPWSLVPKPSPILCMNIMLLLLLLLMLLLLLLLFDEMEYCSGPNPIPGCCSCPIGSCSPYPRPMLFPYICEPGPVMSKLLLGPPVNCWTMARKLVVSVLRSVVGVRREARVRLRVGLETRPGFGPSWAWPVGGELVIGLMVVETTVASETRPEKKRSEEVAA